MKKAQLFIPFAAFLLIIIGFQNCGPAAPSGSNNSSSTATSKVQFAFSTNVDQLAYMSCHELGAQFDTSSYFTFRAGAYGSTAGAGLSSTFLSQQTLIPKNDWNYLITNSAVNIGAKPLLSVRVPNNAQSYYQSTLKMGPGFDATPMLSDLSVDPILSNLINNSSSLIRYYSDGSPMGTRVEGDLNFNNGIQGLNDLQYQMESQGAVVAINYPVAASNVASIRAPAHYFSNLNSSDANQFVYGRGYQLTFRQHPSATYGGGSSTKVRWALGTVNEVDMELGPINSTLRKTTGNTLSCNNNLIFRIVRPGDVQSNPTDTNKINCAMKADNPAALSASDQELLRRARLSLRIEDWYIDWANKCIVPKKSDQATNDCYGAYNNGISVEYDLSKTCVDSPTTNVARACVGLASICIR